MKLLTVTISLFIEGLLLSCLGGAVSNSPSADSRLFLVLLDSTRSYRDYEDARLGLSAALKNLRPGDRFVLARINDQLNPKTFVLLDASSSKLDADLFVPPKTVTEWRNKNGRLAMAWHQIDNNRRAIAGAFQKLQGANMAKRTDLYGALQYAVRWLGDQASDDKTLLVCSDLEHDMGRPTSKPPASSLDAAHFHVRLVFVPGNLQHLSQLETDWKRFFRGAMSFGFFDSGRSSIDLLIPKSQVPIRYPMPGKS